MVLDVTRSLVITELSKVPSDVKYDVYVDTGIVSSAISAEVIVTADERVERLIVDEPMTTRLLEEPVSVDTMAEDVCFVDAAASVEVAMREVTVEPSELVVVTAMVVDTSVELGVCDEAVDDAAEDASSVEEAAVAEESAVDESAEDEAAAVADVWAAVESVEVGVADELSSDVVVLSCAVVVGAVVSLVVGASVVDATVSLVTALVADVASADEVGVSVADETADVAVVLSAVVLAADVLSAEVVVDAAVPTTCLLGIITPAGSSSALMVAKPIANRASMILYVQEKSQYRRDNHVCSEDIVQRW